MKKRRFHILSLGLLLGGCTMMPKYDRPTAPVSGSWPNGSTQTKATNTAAADIDWRDFFEDPRLQSLIGLALENNRDLRIAALRVEQSRAQYRIQRADLFPGVQGNASAVHQRFSGAVTEFNGGSILTTYTLDLAAAYEVDLFGRVRSLKREALERYFATDEARKSVQISLISEVASQYLTLLRYRQAKAIGQQTLEAVQTSYDLNKRSFEAGVASELELQTAAAQVTVSTRTARYSARAYKVTRLAMQRVIAGPHPISRPHFIRTFSRTISHRPTFSYCRSNAGASTRTSTKRSRRTFSRT